MNTKKLTIPLFFFFYFTIFSCKNTSEEMNEFVSGVNSERVLLNVPKTEKKEKLIHAEIVSTNRIKITCKTLITSETEQSAVFDIFAIPLSMVLKRNPLSNNLLNSNVEFEFEFLNNKGDFFTNLTFDKKLVNNYLKDANISGENGHEKENEYVAIPDENFENALIKLSLDDKKDGKIKKYNITFITALNLENYNINSLEGLESFENLKKINCSRNQLKKLDLSKNKNLDYVQCSENPIESFTLEGNDSLRYINICFTPVKKLDLTQSKNLEHLFCYYDDYLTEIDITKNTKLIDFYCGANRFLKTLDISKNPNLVNFDCSSSGGIKTICVYNMKQIKPKWKKEKESKYKVCH